MHFAHERIIHLALGERHGFEMQRRYFCRRWWQESGGVTESYKGEGHFTLGIDIQQAVHVGVHEAAHDPGGQTQGGGDGEQVGEERPVVPAEMAVGAGLIFPGVAPVGAGANDGEWRVCDRRFPAGGFDEDAPIVSRAQPAQAELGRSKVIDAGRQVRKVAANQIQLDFVERSRASCRAKVTASRSGAALVSAGTLSAIAESAATPVWCISAGKGMGSSVG